MPHITETLHQAHETVSGLIEKLQDTTGSAEKTRTNLCQQIKQALLAHTEFEESVFYPAVRELNAEAEKEVEAAFGEHEEVDQMLDELEDMEPTSEEFMETVAQLQEAILEHVRHEEENIFPLARKGIGAEDAEEMSEQHDQMLEEHMQKAKG